ncbi:IS630 transposase-related protein [Clostridium diolis]|uniref:IS630 transposase-related protein n=1 Tax=Clostridium diolis TaxID=223919 RepID=UPI003AF7738A
MEGHIVTAQQDKMIDLLLAGENISDIAKTLNVARSTIYDWKNRSEIKAELESRREQLKKSAQDKITNDIGTFVDNMKKLANSSTDIRVKFQANKYLIDQCLGSPSAAKEDINTNSTGKENTDKNTLKAELNDLKNLTVVK